MKSFFLVLWVFMAFMSCFPDDSQMKAAKKVINLLGAVDGSLEHQKGFDSDSGSINVIVFSLHGVPDSFKSVGMENLSFWVAKTFVKELSNKRSIGDVAQIEILIDSGTAVYSKSFLISDLDSPLVRANNKH